MKQLYILFVFMLLVACGNDKNNEQSKETLLETDDLIVTKQQFENEKMHFGTIKEHDFNAIIKASGMIDVPSHSQSKVSTFVGGYVTKTLLLIGDKVKKGEFLVSLENPEFVEIQQQYLEWSV